THGRKLLRRESLSNQPSPKTVAITRDSDKAGDPILSDEIVDLTELEVRCTEVSAAEDPEVRAWPRLLREARRHVLYIDARIESAERIPPDLPGRLGSAQALEEPTLLLRAQEGLWGFIPAIIRDLDLSKTQCVGRVPSVIRSASVDLLHELLWSEIEKTLASK